jgi:hypothetical protein
MRTLLITTFFLATGCITDDGAIENTCDERPEGCGEYEETDTGDTETE